MLIRVPLHALGFSDKLDFLEGDQKPVARRTKEGAKGQQMKKGYEVLCFGSVVGTGQAVGSTMGTSTGVASELREHSAACSQGL